ncbi:putative iron-regulated membrane protein [Sphingomonas naasensis]|uniref:PepSY domain-containing protein n=1 Tax=Sphingomonas naasensis TaxID=1344951 RepID=A0A4S1WMG2_9SPHN|nr:PepSY-associated TM helix domain-containing protein [Sphingomonas naasensis]NIJ20357.1 putative iron-regulated membrane protein [Sphingomonas naasensis]TGX44469.1 PepSY domain-containing protein [Sphingomonas naasensis]
MSAVREGARQVMAWLHGWTGLLLGHVLFLMCLAGTLSLFKPEIGRWMRPEAVATAAPVDAVAAATGWLAKNAKDSTGWYLTAPDGRANTVEAAYDSGGEFLYRALDPVTGAPVARETMGGEFFYRLHFELQLPFPWGRLLASLAALVMLVALITGIIAHRRIFRDFFTFRPAKGQRSWLDGHNALGVLSLPFHLMITFTGLVTLASLSMPWPITANYGDELMAMYQELTPGLANRSPAGTRAPLAPVAPMLREAERRFGGAPIGRVYVVNPGDAAAVVTVFRSDAAQIGFTPAEISFDGVTGKVLAEWTENRPAVKTYNVVYGLHMARFAPGVLRWLYFLGGAMLTLAIATGLVLWVVKRRERAPLSLGNRLLERLNAGAIGGVLLGSVAYLWANRLLPLELPGRAEVEVSIALWSATVSLVAGAALRPAIAWPALLGALALGCAGAGLLGFATSGVGQWGMSLMLVATATALSLIVRRQIRALRAPPAPRRGRARAAA